MEPWSKIGFRPLKIYYGSLKIQNILFYVFQKGQNLDFWDLGQKSFEIDTKLGDFGPGVAYLGGGTPQMDEKRRSPT